MSVGYPSPGAVYPAARTRPPSAGTAETLVLVALILQIIGGIILIAAIGFVLGFSVLHSFPYAWAAVTAVVGVAAVVVVFLYLVYTLSYQRIRRDEFQAAQTPTLVLGILSLFAGIVPGILYIIAYVKLGDAVREQQPVLLPLPYVTGYGMPPPPPPYSQVACRGCGRVYVVGQFGFCPNCGQKLGT